MNEIPYSRQKEEDAADETVSKEHIQVFELCYDKCNSKDLKESKFSLYLIEGNKITLSPSQQINLENLFLHISKKDASKKQRLSKELYVDLDKMLICRKEKSYKLERKVIKTQTMDLLYVWKSNSNPFDNTQEATWSLYDIYNQYILSFSQLMKANNLLPINEKIKLEGIPYEVNIDKGMQFYINESFRQRPVIIYHPNKSSNLTRLSPYITRNIHSTFRIYNKNNFRLNSDNILRNYSYCFKQLDQCFYATSKLKLSHEFNEIASLPFENLKTLLKKEIIELALTDKHMTYMNFYFQFIDNLDFSGTMFDSIFDLFCMEGFFMINMNSMLAQDIIEPFNFLYMFTLIGYDRIGYNHDKPVFNKTIILYHVNILNSDSEILELKSELESGSSCYRILKEFLFTAIKNQELLEIKMMNGEIKVIYEIEVDESNLNEVKFMRNNQRFNFKNEAILRSGAIIEVINVEIQKSTRTFIVKAKLTNSSELYSKYNGNIDSINLEGINLETNTIRVESLIKTLTDNTEITSLCFAHNNFGKSEESMKVLDKILQASSSITYLDLKMNSIESNPESIKQINEIITNYPNLRSLDLSYNSIQTEMIVNNNTNLKVLL